MTSMLVSLNTKISAEEKQNFLETAKAIGMTPSAVIKAFVHKFCEYGGMPFEMRRETETRSRDIPNKETLEAAEEADYMLSHPEKFKPMPVDEALKALGI